MKSFGFVIILLIVHAAVGQHDDTASDKRNIGIDAIMELRK